MTGYSLGPLLFLLYINDLEKVVSTSAVASFADDTRLLALIREEGDTVLLQDHLNSEVTWSVNFKNLPGDARLSLRFPGCKATISLRSPGN